MKKLIVLTGAGISAESGIKTFRDSDGLWMGYNIEDVATPRAFHKDPHRVLEFYNMRRREVSSAKPNAAHIAIADFQSEYEITIITQNIDDLHERAGSKNVLHLHGEIFKMCSFGDTTTTYHISGDMMPGAKADDDTFLRPAIVWFEEEVPMMPVAAKLMGEADVFMLIGTSLQVYPAAGLIEFLKYPVPKFIIDKKIPPIHHLPNVIIIEKPATEGVPEAIRILRKEHKGGSQEG
ncbi:MAG: Sir2 family NAD-dependent protein deacetylase [Ferruginibacter sp.]